MEYFNDIGREKLQIFFSNISVKSISLLNSAALRSVAIIKLDKINIFFYLHVFLGKGVVVVPFLPQIPASSVHFIHLYLPESSNTFFAYNVHDWHVKSLSIAHVSHSGGGTAHVLLYLPQNESLQ